jgi:tetratricopeptide (TPR) repeat protein
LELKPGSAEVYYNMGWYYQQINDFNKAIELYNHLLNMKDGGGLKSNAYYNLGYLHIQMKMWSEARDYFGKAIQINPNYVEAYYAKGFAHEMLGDIMNAKAYYEEALKLRPSYPNAYNALQRVNNTINR